MLDADSHAKVQMRRKVRGLRSIEQAIRAEQAAVAAAPTVLVATQEAESPASAVPPVTTDIPAVALPEASAVVLDYCSAIRGILNDDHGGPLQPPGLRMADALREVRDSLQRNREAKKGGAETHLTRLVACIDRGLEAVASSQETIRGQVKEIRKIAAVVDPQRGPSRLRRRRFRRLQRRLKASPDHLCRQMAVVMAAFVAGLFAGGELVGVPLDNLDLERWFRLPKGHERRIHGHRHAGMRLVQEGATLMPGVGRAPRPRGAVHGNRVTVRIGRPNRRTSKRKPSSVGRSCGAHDPRRNALDLLAELEQRYRKAP